MNAESSGKVIALSTNCCWNAFNFRKSLMFALQDAGHRVVVLAPRDNYTEQLLALGVEWVDIDMQAKGRNPVNDLATLAAYYKSLAKLRPAFYLGFTIKPNVYGSLACAALGIPTINNIAGLGTLFDQDNLFKTLATHLYKLALRRSHQVFFQNSADESYFQAQHILRGTPTAVLPGSGVDTTLFRPRSVPVMPPADAEAPAAFRFIMSSRLLWAKGVAEYIESARQLQPLYPHVEWHVMGFCGDDNDSVSLAQVEAWESEGLIRYLGVSDHVQDVLPSYDCFVLPSYYNEGTPRSLLEAAACGLPIITTDWTGCRDVVLDRVTGLLCKPRAIGDLISKMRDLLALPPAARSGLGMAARTRAVEQFSDDQVIARYFAAMALGKPPSPKTVITRNGDRDVGQTR
jgi:glycosyltransferase involved in cell wall biosynthesis